MLMQHIEISNEVKDAIDRNLPIVALESTIISHGMPYPKNLETAVNVENIIRENGAVPATIAIINGKIKIGLTEKELDFLAKEENVKKVSRRDIPFIIEKGLNGATTVAATMIIAALADIKVFVTGGIGGVHRNGQNTFDISADLEELSKTDVAVVCAGPKAILDINLTLEYLETKGVPVIGYKTDELPAFYTRESGYKVDYKVENTQEIANAIKIKWDLDLNGGLVVANPIDEKYSMDKVAMDKAISDALEEADKKMINGKKLTPFLLDKIKELTKGKSLESNIELVYSNARVGAKLAKDLIKEFKKL